MVVDASVVLKWLLAEEYRAEARSLLTDLINAGEAALGPSLLPAEVTNALFQQVRRGSITRAEAEQALALFLRLPATLLSPPDLYPRAFAFAATHQLTKTYDALYVALAHLVSGDLWTADERLVNTLQPIAPWVRFIGDYPRPASTS